MGSKPRHVPNDITRAKIKSLAEFLPQSYIAKHMGFTTKTLRKYYREELDMGYIKKDIEIAKTLHEVAVFDKNVSALIFLAKTRLGLVEPKGDPGADEDSQAGESLTINFEVNEAVGDVRVTKGSE
tara:strand:- start:10755 stop:11132 length:378 start_codon:yes stop_codon:yes gene_type:complete